MRVVRTFGQERATKREFAALNEGNREANMRTVYLNAAYFPAIEMLSGVAIAVIVLYGGSQVIDGRDHGRHARRLPRRAHQLLRPDQAALAALHDLPVGDGRARQDLRAARRAAGRSSDARTRSTLPRIAARLTSSTSASPTRRAAARQRTALALDDVDLDDRARRDGRAGRARPAPASRRSRSSSRASTTRRSGRVLVDGHDLRDGQLATRCARSWASSPRRRSSSPARSPRTSRSGARTQAKRRSRQRVSAVGAHDLVSSSRRHPHRRSASAARSSRPASASSSRSRAR